MGDPFATEYEVSKQKDELGDRMKAYEKASSPPALSGQLPIYVRIDGRSFSKFTKGMQRPFDPRMTEAMIKTTEDLVRETKARIGYTQSDEISLVLLDYSVLSEPFFGGKLQKLCSVLASVATASFAKHIRDWEPYSEKYATFDCRVVQLPTRDETANMMLWRNQDAIKNSVSMACRSIASHKQMDHKDQKQMHEMIKEAGVNFDHYPEAFRTGTFVRRTVEQRALTLDEWNRVPPKHRPPLDSLVTRTSISRISCPPLHSVKNRVEFIFNGARPVT